MPEISKIQEMSSDDLFDLAEAIENELMDRIQDGRIKDDKYK